MATKPTPKDADTQLEEVTVNGVEVEELDLTKTSETDSADTEESGSAEDANPADEVAKSGDTDNTGTEAAGGAKDDKEQEPAKGKKVLRQYKKQLQIFKPTMIHSDGCEVKITPVQYGGIQVATLSDFTDKRTISLGESVSFVGKDSIYILSGSQSVVEIVYYQT